jgi:hypothetical protein
MEMANWTKTEVALEFASGIAFDECHKIYVLMDEEQMAQMKEYGYDPLLSSSDHTPEQMLEIIKGWWAASCGLRFVQAVKTTKPDPNEGYVNLIAQGEEDDEDLYDKTECGECGEDFVSDGNDNCEDCREADEENDED